MEDCELTSFRQLLSGKHILVTGGAGFIGSHLAENLLKLNCSVTVLDNFSTGKRENLAALADNKNFRLMEGDIRNMDDCRKALENVDMVLHEAALGSVPRSIKDPVTSTHVNILGFVNMLTASVEAKVERFVYAASSSTYGDSKALPKVEDKIGNPLSPYAITKYVNELYAANFHTLYGIDTVGLRYFNVFGPRQDPAGAYAAVIPKFAKSLLAHKSPVINGDGSYSRDFTFVENVVQANFLALTTEKKEALNTVYNVAFGERTTLNELFLFLREALEKSDPAVKEVSVLYGPERKGDIPHSLASIEKAGILLGYTPRFSVKAGLQATAAWYYEQEKTGNKNTVPTV